MASLAQVRGVSVTDTAIDKRFTESCARFLHAMVQEVSQAVPLQHWLIVLFAWHDPQRSLVKLAQVCRDTAWTLMEALAGFRSLRAALRLIQRRMHSGCQMSTRGQRPNSAQLLHAQAVEWALSWCE